MNKLLIALIGLALIAPAFAADDDPDAVVQTQTVTRLEPAGFTVSLEVTPVVKVSGTNTADVVSLKVTKWQTVRVLKDGVQVGPTRKESLGTRDATVWWLTTRTNINGVIALNMNPLRASWAAAAWNNGNAAGE